VDVAPLPVIQGNTIAIANPHPLKHGWGLDKTDVWDFGGQDIYHATHQFVTLVNMSLKWVTRNYTGRGDFSIFTSDYALYWFDYKAGYDTVFASFPIPYLFTPVMIYL
jgi:hypothetical protein